MISCTFSSPIVLLQRRSPSLVSFISRISALLFLNGRIRPETRYSPRGVSAPYIVLSTKGPPKVFSHNRFPFESNSLSFHIDRFHNFFPRAHFLWYPASVDIYRHWIPCWQWSHAGDNLSY